MKTAVYLTLVLLLLLPSTNVLARQTDQQVVVTFSIDSLAINDLQEDVVDSADEVFIEYSIQEVVQGVREPDNIAFGRWGLATVELGNVFLATDFEPIALRVDQNSSIRVEVHVIESDADNAGWADIFNAGCASDMLPESCIGAILIKTENTEFQGPHSMPIYSSSDLQSGVRDAMTFTWTNGINWASYEMDYSLKARGTDNTLNVNVIGGDEFEGTRLSKDNWWLYNREPAVENGVVTLEGQNDWNLGIASSATMGPNQGALVLFQYQPGRMGMFINRNDWNSTRYQRWMMSNSGEQTWTMGTLQGSQGQNAVSYESADLLPDNWYYLLFRVNGDGSFDTWIWNRDDPTGYDLNVHETPYEQSWTGGGWSFLADVYAGRLELDYFRLIQFPADFEMPSTPPRVD